MHIKKILLYSNKKEFNNPHVFPFSTDKINIVFGETASGKTTIFNIIDYCFGSADLGGGGEVVADNVKYVALIIEHRKQYYFIARSLDFNKTNILCLEIQHENTLPTNDDISQAYVRREHFYSLSLFKQRIAAILGISQEWNELEIKENDGEILKLEGIFEIAQSLSIIHSTTLINKKKLLTEKLPSVNISSMKNYFPFFLKIYDASYFALLENIKSYKKEKNRLFKEYSSVAEQERVQKSMGLRVLQQAQNENIFTSDVMIDNTLFLSDIISYIDSIIHETGPNLPNIPKEKDEFREDNLKQLKKNYKKQIDDLQDKINFIKKYENEQKGYDEKVNNHFLRLKSIEIFKASNGNNDLCCPLCNEILKHPVPTIQNIEKTFENIRNQRYATALDFTKIPKQIELFEKEQEKLRKEMLPITEELKRITSARKLLKDNINATVRKHSIIEQAKSFLIYIKDLPKQKKSSRTLWANYESTKKKLKDVENQKENQDEKKADKEKEARLKLEEYMTEYAGLIDWEYKGCDLILEKDWTYRIKKESKDTKMKDAGSETNIRILHLIFYLTLHKYFIKNNIDTTLNFLSFEGLLSDQGNTKRSEILNFIYKEWVDKSHFNKNLQIILVEGSDIKKELLDESIYNTIFLDNNNGLVPNDWRI